MCISDANATVDRIVKYLERCGDCDIQAGIGALIGISTEERLKSFRVGLMLAVYGKDMQHAKRKKRRKNR